jgi:hypothetical protein
VIGKTKVLLFAMDACDPDLARSLAAAGKLPNLARVLAGSACATSRNPYGLYVGSLWSSFFTARTAARTGFHCWEEVDSKSYERRLTTPLEIKGTPFWETLSAAGKRVAILDVPHSRAVKPIDGVMVCEYACHDRHFGFHSWPPELAKDIESRIGLHPILTADPYEVREWSPDDYVHRAGDLRTADEEQALHAGLLAGIERKATLSAELLAQGGWDLFLTVFGESHSIGHQQWHLHDRTHQRHDPTLAAELGDPLVNVYRRIDAALGEHLALAGPDASVFVLLSHGIGPHYDGTHLLHEILRRLDQGPVAPGSCGRRSGSGTHSRVDPGAGASRRDHAAAPAPGPRPAAAGARLDDAGGTRVAAILRVPQQHRVRWRAGQPGRPRATGPRPSGRRVRRGLRPAQRGPAGAGQCGHRAPGRARRRPHRRPL